MAQHKEQLNIESWLRLVRRLCTSRKPCFHVKPKGFIRSEDKCPLTWTAFHHLGTDYKPWEWKDAASHLGLDEHEAIAVVRACDGWKTRRDFKEKGLFIDVVETRNRILNILDPWLS